MSLSHGVWFLHGDQGLLLNQGAGFDHGPVVGQGCDALPMLMVVLKNPVAAHVGLIGIFRTKDVEVSALVGEQEE